MMCITTTHLHSSSFKTQILYPLDKSSPLLPPLLPPLHLLETIPLSVSMSLTTLDISFRWNQHYLSFRYWLISLNRVSRRFTHIVACLRISFFLKAEESVVGM